MEMKSSVRRIVEAVVGVDGAQTVAASYSTARGRSEYLLRPAFRGQRTQVRSFAGRHRGETCAIIGNGPSLKQTPLELLSGVSVFSLNRLYLMFDQLAFLPSYHVVVNRHVVSQCAGELKALDLPVFTTLSNLGDLQGGSATTFAFPSISGPRFDETPLMGLWEGGTVTYVAMQLAYFMGFEKVLLVGVDHSFSTKGPANQLVESSGDDANHFDPRYFGKGFKWQLPDLNSSEIAYSLARASYQAAGREIVDCTVGGKLDVFRKSSLEDELGDGSDREFGEKA